MISIGHKILTLATTILLLNLMGLRISNQILFVHTHYLEDGSRVTHAHPYDKSAENDPLTSHHHSKKSLLFFSQGNDLVVEKPNITVEAPCFITESKLTACASTVPKGWTHTLPGRSPPTLAS